MAVESTMLALGTTAPDFSLPDTVSGNTVSLATFAGKKGLLVMFLCPHCPYVKHVQVGLASLLKEYDPAELGIVAISSNDVAQFPEDGPDGLRGMAKELGFAFPYCYDESQQTAKDYQAACTPDLFVFDAEQRLQYRGQFDDSRPSLKTPVTGASLRAALSALSEGRFPSTEQKPSVGCNIKWRAGTGPA